MAQRLSLEGAVLCGAGGARQVEGVAKESQKSGVLQVEPKRREEGLHQQSTSREEVFRAANAAMYDYYEMDKEIKEEHACVACLDSAATVDVLGKEDCERAQNIQDLEVPRELQTASDPATITQTGDCRVEPGVEIEQGWMAPWLDYTLISLSKRMQEGYTLLAAGTEAWLTSPCQKVYKFILREGLLVP